MCSCVNENLVVLRSTCPAPGSPAPVAGPGMAVYPSHVLSGYSVWVRGFPVLFPVYMGLLCDAVVMWMPGRALLP